MPGSAHSPLPTFLDLPDPHISMPCQAQDVPPLPGTCRASFCPVMLYDVATLASLLALNMYSPRTLVLAAVSAWITLSLFFLFIMAWPECHPKSPFLTLCPCMPSHLVGFLAEWPQCSLHTKAKHDFFKRSQQPCDVGTLLSPSN